MVEIIGGKQEIRLTPSNLCSLCFPKPIPAIIIHRGQSVCVECFKKIQLKEAEEREDKDGSNSV